jgi:hypothetical protein
LQKRLKSSEITLDKQPGFTTLVDFVSSYFRSIKIFLDREENKGSSIV